MRISDWSSDVCSSDLKEGYSGVLSCPQPELKLIRSDPSKSPQPPIGERRRNAALRIFPSAPLNECPSASSMRWRSSSRSEEHTSELQSLMRISYAVFCLKKKNKLNKIQNNIKISN